MLDVAVLKFLLSGGDGYIPYLSRHMFSNEISSVIFDLLKSHHSKNGNIPNIDDIKTYLYRIFTESSDRKQVRKLLREIKKAENTREVTEDIISDIIQKSQLRRLIQDILPKLDSLERIDLDIIQNDLDKIKTTQNTDGEVLKLSEIEKRVRDKSVCVPTCFETLNEFLDPGLAPGEIGLIQANSGVGKTLLSINFASAAARLGFEVWFVTLDEMGQDIAARFEVHLSNFRQNNSKWIDNIKIVDLSDGGKVVDLEVMMRKHGKPQLMIIDGTDEFLDQSSKDIRHQIGNIYRSIRRLSRRKSGPIPIWLTTQSTSSSEGKLKKGQSDLSENKVVKAAESSVIISFNQTEEEFKENIARCYISKIRRPRGKYHTFKVDIFTDKQLLSESKSEEEKQVFESLKKKRRKRDERENRI